MATEDSTAERLRKILHYDPETGVFTRKVSISNNAKVGDIVGTITGSVHKRVVVWFDGKLHYAHRLAWLYMTGKWPSNHIDHRDVNGLNNRFSNLRDVPQPVNSQNIRGPRNNNATGFLGVSRGYHRFKARITVNRKSIHLGHFATPEEAHAAYLDAKRRLHAGCTL